MQTEVPTTDEQHGPQYDRANDRYVLYHDEDGTATLTATIVHGLAAITDVDVSQGEFSLYDSVDPDALERIFASKADEASRTSGHVAFTALDHQVYVYATGEIHVYPPEAARGSPADAETTRR
ncbi:HalOD1 output domain-containing protein [Natrialbaceae archaeon A-gly3]